MTSIRSRLRWILAVAIVIPGLAGALAAPPELSAQPPAATAPQAAAPAATPPATPAVAPRVPRTLDVPDGALVAAGKAPELDLLYTGDAIGYIEPCG